MKVSLKYDVNIGQFEWNPCTFISISPWILIKMRKVSDKCCRENQNTHFMFNNFIRKSCSLWYNTGEINGRPRQATDDNIIRHMRFACWISKDTDTHSQYLRLFYYNSGNANAPQCYVILTLPLLFHCRIRLFVPSVLVLNHMTPV